jgi:site-specific recombinase XerD
MRLCKAIEGYVLTSQTENKSPHTLKIIKWDEDIFVKWLIGSPVLETSEARDVQLETLTTDRIREFIEHEQNRGVSAHTVHQEYRVLRAFLRWCMREEILIIDPTVKIKPPRLPGLLPKALEPEQVRALLGYLQKNRTPKGKRDELMIHTLLGTGLEASDLLSLKVSSVLPEPSYILVRQGKGRKDRVVP